MSETYRHEDRLTTLRNSRLNGLDEVEIGPDAKTLVVRFFHDAPNALAPRHLRIRGGIAVKDIQVVDVQLVNSDDPDQPTLAEVFLDRSGDASTYELELFDLEHMDPRYRSAPFTFFPDFEADLDCERAPSPTDSADVAAPPLDYLAKDYAGFRQLILDRLAVTMPAWTERHIPDVGIMMVELLAYTADRLSYYQDAVATEAYLGTARRRISVRRHARLIDYQVHEGAAARALVQIDPGADVELHLAEASFSAGYAGKHIDFQPVKTWRTNADLRETNVALAFHCWGNTGCVLVKGATSATLVDPAPKGRESLRSGDFLIFEVLDSRLGGTPDADLSLRHPVRLTEVRRSHDPLLDVPLLEISWSSEDATPIDFPLDTGDDDPVGQVTVARGNLVLVDQAREIVEGEQTTGALRTVDVGPGRQRTLTLYAHGLGFATAVGPRDSAQTILFGQDPRAATPMIERLTSWPLDADGRPKTTSGTPWVIRPDLIESAPDDPHATVEIDDGGVAILRFGDGVCGRDPSGLGFEIAYRASLGAAGNLGADSIGALRSTDQPDAAGWKVRNPLAASGGAAPEDVKQVRLLAPLAFKDTLERAVTADDYARLAERLEPGVQHATCALVRSGVRWIARVAIDPLGTDMPDESLVETVAAALKPYRHIGHDIEVTQGLYVPLLLVLDVSVSAGFVRGHVRQALSAALGSGVAPDGTPAPFSPDRLGFGTPIPGSPIIAAARAVAGVSSVELVELARLFDRERGGYENGVLTMAWNEIPRLDNDPLRPDHGRLELRLRGGLP